jgi:hypothetical protein
MLDLTPRSRGTDWYPKLNPKQHEADFWVGMRPRRCANGVWDATRFALLSGMSLRDDFVWSS